jgi:hypothetical protein
MYFAEPEDDYARRYVCDRTARLYSADKTGRSSRAGWVGLRGSDALRFIFWNHHQCYGTAASPAACN